MSTECACLGTAISVSAVPGFIWCGAFLVSSFGVNGPLRQYFRLYRAISQREGERGEKRIDESENVQTTPTRTYYKRSRPLPYCNPNYRTPQHWKFTQHHRTTQPPPGAVQCKVWVMALYQYKDILLKDCKEVILYKQLNSNISCNYRIYPKYSDGLK